MIVAGAATFGSDELLIREKNPLRTIWVRSKKEGKFEARKGR
jgi:hypothetical protein